MISSLDFFQRVLKKLEENNIEYMIVGSVASMLYGEPRLTRDIDIDLKYLEDWVDELGFQEEWKKVCEA